jgi:hypothetical protein
VLIELLAGDARLHSRIQEYAAGEQPSESKAADRLLWCKWGDVAAAAV